MVAAVAVVARPCSDARTLALTVSGDACVVAAVIALAVASSLGQIGAIVLGGGRRPTAAAQGVGSSRHRCPCTSARPVV